MAGEKLRIIYRNYATLYFVFVVDSSESELGILDLIQVLGPASSKMEFTHVNHWRSRSTGIRRSFGQDF